MENKPVKQFPETPFFAIFSDFDAPQGNMMVVVREIRDDNSATLRYLMVVVREIRDDNSATLRYLKPDAFNKGWMVAGISLITPVRDFGVAVEREGSCIRAVRVDEGIATYDDGEPRKWQERWPAWHPYNPDLDIIVQWAIEKHGKDAQFVETPEESFTKEAEELLRIEARRSWEAEKDAWPGVPA